MFIRKECLNTTINLSICEKEPYDGGIEKETVRIRIDFCDVPVEKRLQVEEASRKFLNQIADFLARKGGDHR